MYCTQFIRFILLRSFFVKRHKLFVNCAKNTACDDEAYACINIKMTYVTLNLSQKTAIRNEHSRRKFHLQDISHEALSTWGLTNFNLNKSPIRRTICRILKIAAPTNTISKNPRSMSFLERKGGNHRLEKSIFSGFVNDVTRDAEHKRSYDSTKISKISKDFERFFPCRRSMFPEILQRDGFISSCSDGFSEIFYPTERAETVTQSPLNFTYPSYKIG